MAVYTHSDVKKQGVQLVKDNTDLIAVVKNPLKADDYATAFGKIIASAAFAPTDISITDSGNDVLMTSNPKSGIDPSGSALNTDDVALAFFDTSGTRVLLVEDIVDRDILNEDGDTLDIPAAQVYIRELTSV